MAKRTPARKKARRKGRPTTPRAERSKLTSEARIDVRCSPERIAKYRTQAELDERANLSDWFRWLADQRCGLI